MKSDASQEPYCRRIAIGDQDLTKETLGRAHDFRELGARREMTAPRSSMDAYEDKCIAGELGRRQPLR